MKFEVITRDGFMKPLSMDELTALQRNRHDLKRDTNVVDKKAVVTQGTICLPSGLHWAL